MATETLPKARRRAAAAPAPAANDRAQSYAVGWDCPRIDAGAAIRARVHLLARERRAVDRALLILASYMRSPSHAFSSPGAVQQYLCLHLGLVPHEVFGVLFLDAQNRLITFEALFRGTLTQTSVYPREVVLQALAHNAASVILAHNHPSGITEPSGADEALTRTLRTALALVDVRVLDHIIVSGNNAMSFAERGLL